MEAPLSFTILIRVDVLWSVRDNSSSLARRDRKNQSHQVAILVGKCVGGKRWCRGWHPRDSPCLTALPHRGQDAVRIPARYLPLHVNLRHLGQYKARRRCQPKSSAAMSDVGHWWLQAVEAQ